MKEIVQKDNPALRLSAEPVNPEDITGEKIQGIIADMKEALEAEPDGVGLAAPQIGIPLRIFIVSHRAFLFAEEGSKKESGEILDEEPAKTYEHKDLVFINPELVKKSKKTEMTPEGCLSVRFWYGQVKRSTNATITAYDETGKKFTRGAGGLLAQIFQHEIDHLDGMLFTDTATDLEEIIPDKDAT